MQAEPLVPLREHGDARDAGVELDDQRLSSRAVSIIEAMDGREMGR